MTKKKHQKLLILIVSVFILVDSLALGALFFFKQSETLTQKKTTQVSYPELAVLKKKSFTFQELTDFFTETAKKKGAVYAYNLLKIAPVPPNTDMHLLGHAVGDVLYKQEGVNGIKYCTQDFRNACSHSIVIALFTKYGLAAIPKISAVCKEAPGGKSAYTMCFHGLGHGVLAYTNYDMEKAIQLCRYVGTTTYNNAEAIECGGGTVMEMMSGVNDPAQWDKQKTRYFKENDPLSPCDASFMPDDTKQICYIYLTPHLFEYVGTDMQNIPTDKNLTDAFLLCNNIPKDQKENRQGCYGGFGKEFVTMAQYRDIRKIDQMNKQQLAKVYHWCQLTDDMDGQEACVQYAVGSLLWGGDNDRHAAINFCDLVDNEKVQSACVDSLISTVGYYIDSQSYKKDFCSELPKDYVKTCKTTLRVS